MKRSRASLAVLVILVLAGGCQSTPPPVPVPPSSTETRQNVFYRFSYTYHLIQTRYIRETPDDELIDNAIRGAAKSVDVPPDPWLHKNQPPRASGTAAAVGNGNLNIPTAQIVRLSRAISEFRKMRPDIPEEKLIDAATRGMVDGLGDQSRYLSSAESKSRLSRMRQAGIGLELTKDGDDHRVVRPLPNSPAERAGFRRGDRITRIDGVSVHSLALENVVLRLQGDPGSPVSIRRLRRDGGEDELTLQREFIHFDPVSSTIVDQNYVHIRLWSITFGSTKSLQNHLAQAKTRLRANPRGIILDLRDNSGGPLTAVLDVADFFLSTGIICRTEGRMPEARQIFRAKPPDETDGIPLVVLVDKNTASGAEVIAGTLQTNRHAYVIGSRTHGMGNVRTMMRVDRDFGLSLTTARLSTPAGPIHGRGIVPDLCTSIDTPSTRLGERCPQKENIDEPGATSDRDMIHALDWLKKQHSPSSSR